MCVRKQCELDKAFEHCAQAKAHQGPFGDCEKASAAEGKKPAKQLPKSYYLVVVVEKSRFVIIREGQKNGKLIFLFFSSA